MKLFKRNRTPKPVHDPEYIELNNLYLDIERGDRMLTRAERIRLDFLLCCCYPNGATVNKTMHDWWQDEFHKLPNWLAV